MSTTTATPSHAVGQIVPIHQSTFNEEPAPAVDARDLHHALKVGRDFTSWMKGRIKECGFTEGEDYLLTETGEQLPSGTKYRKEYFITLDMAKHLAMLEKNATGHKVRQGFIDYEKHTRALVAAPQSNNLPAIPKDPLELFLMTAEAIKQLSGDITEVKTRTIQAEDMALEASTRVDELQATFRIHEWQKFELKEAVNHKVKALRELAGGLTGSYYAMVWGFVKRHFKVSKYDAIPAIRFEEAKIIITNITLDQLGVAK